MKMSFSIPDNLFLFYVIINSCQISLHNGSENNFQSGTFLRFKVTTIVIVMKYQTICSFHTSAWLKLIENRRGLNKFQHNLSDLETIKISNFSKILFFLKTAGQLRVRMFYENLKGYFSLLMGCLINKMQQLIKN